MHFGEQRLRRHTQSQSHLWQDSGSPGFLVQQCRLGKHVAGSTIGVREPFSFGPIRPTALCQHETRDSEDTKSQRRATRRFRHGPNDTHPRQSALDSRTHDPPLASLDPRVRAHHGRDELWPPIGGAMVDINNDGYLDIYVSVSGPPWSRGESRANLLFINNRDGTFTEAAAKYGIADTGFTTHAVFFDYNGDGFLDLFLLNNSPQ